MVSDSNGQTLGGDVARSKPGRSTILALVNAIVALGMVTATSTSASASPRTNTEAVHATAKASKEVGIDARSKDTDAAIRNYWTPDRLKAAIPADHVVDQPTKLEDPDDRGVTSNEPASRIEPAAAATATTNGADQAHVAPLATSHASNWPGSFWGPPATTTGKVFFTGTDGAGYACSASAVNSEAKNAVLTAGHCVNDGHQGWHANWIFIPDYSDGWAPFGVWTARELWSTGEWFYNADFRYDVGAVVVNSNSNTRLVDVVGGQGIAWNQARGQYVFAFGYPADPPFDGKALKYCDGYTYDDWWSFLANLGLDCDFTGGASGGPWLAYFGGTFGYINGVNSYKYSWLPGSTYSPYFGGQVGSLYNAVRSRY
jgi:V8-like Glu-specific endopeptidase